MMNNNGNSTKREILFEHNKFFHAYRNILYLSNSKCYTDNTLEKEIAKISEKNSKNIESIIYFSLSLKSRLRQSLFNEIFKTIDEINSEISTDLINSDIKKTLEAEKEEILDIFFDEINETISIINEHNQHLKIEKEQLKNQFVTDKITPFILDKESSVQSLAEELAILESETEKTKKELVIIRESEDILHKRSFFDLFQKKIPLPSEIDKLSIEPQEKSILSSLIKILNNLFSTLDSGFSYTKIVETRHQLTALYLTQIKELHLLKSQQQSILLKLKHHYKLIDIDYFLHTFINQLGFLIEYWDSINLQLSMLSRNILLSDDIITPIFSFLDKFTLYYGEKEEQIE